MAAQHFPWLMNISLPVPKVETIYHIDLYRLEDEAEAMRAGMEEYLFSGAICLVEWPEKAPGIFPLQTVHVYIERAGCHKEDG